MKIQLLRWTSDHLEKKVPVAATAWTLFYFCNPSNVLSPLWTPKLIFREVNSQYYWGPVKSHLQRKKTGKSQLSLFHWFWTHSPPHLRFRGQIGRRIVERIEGRMLWLQKSSYALIKGGGEMITFSKENHLLKKRVDLRRRWIARFCRTKQIMTLQKQGAKKDMALACVHVYQLLETRCGDSSHRVYTF